MFIERLLWVYEFEKAREIKQRKRREKANYALLSKKTIKILLWDGVTHERIKHAKSLIEIEIDNLNFLLKIIKN